MLPRAPSPISACRLPIAAFVAHLKVAGRRAFSNSKNRPLTVFGPGFKIAGFPHNPKLGLGEQIALLSHGCCH